MRTSTLRRLDELTAGIQARASSPIWVEMTNCTVRIDVGGQRGQSQTFGTVREAARFAESQIDAHDLAAGSISVDHLADLYPDGAALRAHLRVILPVPIERNGTTISADDLPAVRFSDLKTDRPANVRLLLVAGAIYEHFGGEFRQRYAAGALTEDDNRLFTALFVVWCWDRRDQPDALLPEFVALVRQVARLPAIRTSD